jgi:hypothetical protein
MPIALLKETIPGFYNSASPYSQAQRAAGTPQLTKSRSAQLDPLHETPPDTPQQDNLRS